MPSKKDPNFPMQGRGGAMGGKYSTKSTNLSNAELRAANAKKAAGRRQISQSDTVRVGSRTTDRAGKAITGTIALSDGKKAVYKGGRRVQVAPKKAAVVKAASPKAVTPDAPSGPSKVQRQNKNVKPGTIKVGAKGQKANRWNGKAWVPVAGSRTGYVTSASSSTSPAGVSTAKWAALSPAQKSAFRGNVQKLARAQGMTMAQAAAKVAAGKDSVLAKAANKFASGKKK